jgi:hypothetical protein
LIGWKKKYLRENWKKDGDIGAVVKTYCNNFLKYNPQLREKRTFKFDQKRDENYTLGNFTGMYRDRHQA